MDSKDCEVASIHRLRWQCGTCANTPEDVDAAADHADQVAAQANLPVIQSLSLRLGNKLDLKGSTSARSGVVEALTSGSWKGIADVSNDGTFHNDNVPPSYLDGKNIHVRVNDQGVTSHTLLATGNFVHPRSVMIHPTASKAADQNFYNWNIQWADYQPTGYRIAHNTLFSVWVIGDPDQATICIGTQGLAEQLDRTKQTHNMLEFPLKVGKNIIYSGAYGGALHFRNNGTTEFRVVLGLQTTPMPYFILGQTPADDWQRMLSESDPAAEVQLVGDRVVIAAYADTYSRYARGDVDDIVRSHETVLNIEAEAAGLDGSSPVNTRSAMWMYAVEAASTVMPSASTGYIAMPHGTDPNNEYMLSLLGGQAHRRWVTLHEYGHHFQTRMNSISPLFNEVSVNIYAAAVARQYKNDYTDHLRNKWPSIKAWLAKPRSQKQFLEAPDQHALFEQLRLGFGASFLTDWNRAIRTNPPAENDVITLTSSLCQAAHHNLADFFADWGVITEGDATWRALHALGLPAAPHGLTDHQPYTDFSDN